MDTKWKKWKTALSFAAFFAGVSLLICGLTAVMPPLVRGEGVAWREEDLDYQDTEDFQSCISMRLDELFSAAVRSEAIGGNWSRALGQPEDVPAEAYPVEEALPAQTPEPMPVETDSAADAAAAETVPETKVTSAEAETVNFWDEYMESMAWDKNLLYAVSADATLLYTNVDALTGYAGKLWGGNFTSCVDRTAYNFILIFNRNGDGKVELWKDGEAVDVYGDGVFDQNSRWFLPGYSNFTVDAGSAVVCMAAAKTPRPYYIDGQIWTLYNSTLTCFRSFRLGCVLLALSLLLLAAAVVFRKAKRQADRALLRVLEKLWFGPKAVCLLLAPAVGLAALLTNLSDLPEELGVFCAGFTVCFWLLYLGLLDLIGNRGRQKRPLRDAALKRPVQKRLAARGRLMAVLGLFFPCGALALAMVAYALFDSLYTGLALCAALVCIAAAVLCPRCFRQAREDRRLAKDLGALIDQISLVKSGNLTDGLTLPEDADLCGAARELNDIQQGLDAALREQMKSERMKVELITNVSHDIKTPLTSIISYIELLKEEELPDSARDFVHILDEKSQRLKAIVQDVFEVSKAAADQLPLKPEALDLGKLLRQTMADMALAIEASGLTVKSTIPAAPVMIWADGQRLYRVFQNLLQNALQYSLPGSRVFLTLESAEGRARARIKNTSAAALDDTVDFTERFFRGDASRADGGSGLGLSIAKSFTEASGGSFSIRTEADLFTAEVSFPLHNGA